MSESVIITGRDLHVDHQAEQPNPKRRRPPEYIPPAPAGTDLVAALRMACHHNPYWSAEANDYADAHSDERPVDLARRFADHRIEIPHAI